ncbi:putative nuclease HARBI1 [Pleurodeles waltl]|uniref:putative nuclease HARBI1 n=1 Tax=Pleurodeles waltl TaxID=8319 RepID=UPI003709812B
MPEQCDHHGTGGPVGAGSLACHSPSRCHQPTVQVLSVLHYLASSSFQVTVGLAAGMSRPMFSNVLRDVLCALLKHLFSYIRFPQHAELPTVKAAFDGVAHVPDVIGAVDGTHITLVPLRRSEQVYRNRKNLNSVNVQLVCFADQYISEVMARYPDSVHDSFILRNSSILHMMAPFQRDRAWLMVCTPAYMCLSALCTLVSLPYHPSGLDMTLTSVHRGDSGYPNLPWLLTPVRHPTSAAEDRYKEAHCHTRQVIERCFGVLKARFWCLHVSGGALLYKPQVCQIIAACCMLHNLALRRQILLLEAEDRVAVSVADEGDMGSDKEENDDAADSRAELIRHYLS